LIRALLLGAMLLGATPAIAAEVAIATATEVAIAIDNFTFAPLEMTVPAGTTVVWTNHDDIPHTVTDQADPRGIHSPPLDTDESYRRQFLTPGRYGYFCSLHPHMTATVVVQ